MNVLQFSSDINSDNDKGMVTGIHEKLCEFGHRSYIVYVRGSIGIGSDYFKIAIRFEELLDFSMTSFIGKPFQTSKIIRVIRYIQPDIIHFHSLELSDFNYVKLFQYLKKSNIPIIWDNDMKRRNFDDYVILYKHMI